MLEKMHVHSRVRRLVLATAPMMVVTVLAACSVPPLHRSVSVQTNRQGIPVHASGRVDHDRYTVVRGDTLYSIAFRAGVDYHQLARWNHIRAPYTIHPGQTLRLDGPAGKSRKSGDHHEVAANGGFQTVPSTRTPKQGTSTAHSTSAHTSKPTPATTTVVAVAGKPTKPTHEATTARQPAAASPGGTRKVAGITWRWPAEGKVIHAFHASGPMPGIDIAGKAGDPVRAAASGVVTYSGDGLVGYGELIIIKHNDDYMSAYGHNSKRLVNEGEHVEAGQLIARMGSTGAPRDELEFQVRYKGKPVNPLKYLPKR